MRLHATAIQATPHTALARVLKTAKLSMSERLGNRSVLDAGGSRVDLCKWRPEACTFLGTLLHSLTLKVRKARSVQVYFFLWPAAPISMLSYAGHALGHAANRGPNRRLEGHSRGR